MHSIIIMYKMQFQKRFLKYLWSCSLCFGFNNSKNTYCEFYICCSLPPHEEQKYKKKMSNRKVWSKNSSIPHSITQIITKQQRIENNQKIKRKINDLNNNYVHLKSMCMHDE